MEIKKLYIKANLGELVKVLEGYAQGEVGNVERIIYDSEGLKYDIRSLDGKLLSDVNDEDLQKL